MHKEFIGNSGQYRNAVASGQRFASRLQCATSTRRYRVTVLTRSGGDISFYKIQE